MVPGLRIAAGVNQNKLVSMGVKRVAFDAGGMVHIRAVSAQFLNENTVAQPPGPADIVRALRQPQLKLRGVLHHEILCPTHDFRPNVINEKACQQALPPVS